MVLCSRKHCSFRGGIKASYYFSKSFRKCCEIKRFFICTSLVAKSPLCCSGFCSLQLNLNWFLCTDQFWVKSIAINKMINLGASFRRMARMHRSIKTKLLMYYFSSTSENTMTISCKKNQNIKKLLLHIFFKYSSYFCDSQLDFLVSFALTGALGKLICTYLSICPL